MKKLITSAVLAVTMIASSATAANAVGAWPY